MKQPLYIFLFCMAGLFYSANTQPTPAPQQLGWYSGKVKIPLYHHRGLRVVPAHKDSVLPRSSSSNYVGQIGNWRVYRSDSSNLQPRVAQNNRRFQLYSTGPDWRNSTLYAQAPGVVVVFKKKLSVQQINQWFAREKLKSKRLSSDDSYLIIGIDGEDAIMRAARIFESGDAEIAQPNWVIQVD